MPFDNNNINVINFTTKTNQSNKVLHNKWEKTWFKFLTSMRKTHHHQGERPLAMSNLDCQLDNFWYPQYPNINQISQDGINTFKYIHNIQYDRSSIEKCPNCTLNSVETSYFGEEKS